MKSSATLRLMRCVMNMQPHRVRMTLHNDLNCRERLLVSQATINPIIIFIPPSSSFYAQQPTHVLTTSSISLIHLALVTEIISEPTPSFDFGDGATQFSATNDNQSHTYNAPNLYGNPTSYNFCNVDDPNVFTQEVCIEPFTGFYLGSTSESNGCVFLFAAINTTVNPEICALSLWNMHTDIDCSSNWNCGTHTFTVNGTNTGSETPEIEVLHAGPLN